MDSNFCYNLRLAIHYFWRLLLFQRIEEQIDIFGNDTMKVIENGLSLIEKWLRNKNTIEFLGIWEGMYNPDFNSPEFEGIKSQAGLNRFVLSVKQWVGQMAKINYHIHIAIGGRNNAYEN